PVSPTHRDLHSCPTRRSSDLLGELGQLLPLEDDLALRRLMDPENGLGQRALAAAALSDDGDGFAGVQIEVYPVEGLNLPCLEEADRKSTRLNSSHVKISYAVF